MTRAEDGIAGHERQDRGRKKDEIAALEKASAGGCLRAGG
jgi:hypothetical protein